MLHERAALSRREASLRPARARRSRDHLGVDSVRSKLPPLYPPVSPSPVSREASRDLWRSISPSTCLNFERRFEGVLRVCKYNGRINIHVQWKVTLYFRHFRLDEAAQTGVLGQRGRRKTAELHTSSAK